MRPTLKRALKFSVAFAALVAAATLAQEPAAEASKAKAPAASAADAATLVREGVRLYDQGSYEAAVEKYTQALALEPENLTALYERAMTLLDLKQFDRCMADVERGLQKEGPTQAGFYDLAGTCSSEQGQFEKARALFEEGLGRYPKNEQLHFNLAVVFNRMDRRREAREQFKQVLEVNPERASAYLNLGHLYREDGYKMPALFMDLRFLWAEPSSTRSLEVVKGLEGVLGQGVQASDPRNITITLDSNAPTDEGDFGPLDLALSVSRAAAITEQAQTKSQAEKDVATITNLVQIAGEVKDRKLRKTFVWKQALSQLVAMQKDKVLEPFLYREYALAGVAGAQAWLDAHREDLARLERWVTRAEE